MDVMRLVVLGIHQHQPIPPEVLDQALVDVGYVIALAVAVDLKSVADGADEEVFREGCGGGRDASKLYDFIVCHQDYI